MASAHTIRPLVAVLALLLGLAPRAWGKVTEPAYRDLASWAANKDLRAVARGDELLLTNRWARLRFRRDSGTMSFNDVEFRLSDRTVTQQGRFRISQRDIESLVGPLVSPPKRTGPAVRLVAINAGHGGKDPGNLEGARREKVYTLALAKDLSARLRAAGLRVALIRDDDTFVDLGDRAAEANRLKADLYVSLHFNSYEGDARGRVRGLETYCLTPAGAASSNDAGLHGGGWHEGNAQDRENITLAHLVHRAILEQTDLPDRGVRRARFKELTLLHMPGVLVEAGYMTHPSDARFIYGKRSREQLADAIVEGILRHKRLLERGQPE
jgi:N-acetylmuramoyl-L-alanine amidase